MSDNKERHESWSEKVNGWMTPYASQLIQSWIMMIVVFLIGIYFIVNSWTNPEGTRFLELKNFESIQLLAIFTSLVVTIFLCRMYQMPRHDSLQEAEEELSFAQKTRSWALVLACFSGTLLLDALFICKNVVIVSLWMPMSIGLVTFFYLKRMNLRTMSVETGALLAHCIFFALIYPRNLMPKVQPLIQPIADKLLGQ